MYLKRLVSQGFKSFADRTEFEFRPGVTGIVGPNGCGKSNVVDSIKWVLGDQSARSLRGKQMQDVIFNGSGTRKSASMAQVDLTFDNTDRRLARDTDEVTITRRLYRSGESEYLINGEQVRLKDIRELFMDTGVGGGAYSIIEQGKVDVLLQANPAERRLIFEEAAGISRYKARKKEAERKLERVEQNLLRVEDIIEELEKRLRSIKYQAGKARNFQEYDRQLREKRATYSLAEYHRLTQRQNELAGEEASLTDAVTELRTALEAADARTADLDQQLIGLETELRTFEGQVLSNASEITANRERIDGSHQRIEELVAARGRALRRLAVEKQRAARLRQQIEAEAAAVQQIEAQLAQASANVDAFAAQDRDLSREITTLQARREDDKAAIIELMRRTAQINNEISSLEQRRQQFEAQKARLHERAQQVEAELAALRETKAAQDARAAEILEQIQAHQQQIDERKRQAAELDASRAELNSQIAAAKEFRSGLLSRRDLLMKMERQLEGVDKGVRELLHQKEQDPTGQTFGYVRGLVADFISTDVSHAVLIETALGEFDQYIVVDNSEAFYADADRLAELPGRIHAICLDCLPPFVNGHDFRSQEGFVAHAMDLVRCPEGAEQLVRHVLGRTIIVKTLEDAQRMARNNPPTYRYLTLAGQMIDPYRGVCEVGPIGVKTGLISRKSELRDIDEQLVAVDQRIAAATERLQRTSEEVQHLEALQQELRNALFEARRAEVENNAARNATQNAMDRLLREQPLIASELKSFDMQMAEAAERAARSQEKLRELEAQNREREERIRTLDEQIESLVQRRAQFAEQLTEARGAGGQLAQRRSMQADTLRRLREQGQASEEAVRVSAREADDAVHRITQAERTVLAAQSRLAELYATRERLDRELRSRQEQREAIRHELESISAQTRSQRTALGEVEERLHAIQMELQEIRIRTEELVNRIAADLNINLVELYATYEHTEQDWAALEAEINDLTEKIRRLGNVNLDAISEQEELEKRAEFLISQRDDLRGSRKQLEELIEQLNVECRTRFTETFEAVRVHFQELFRKLFGGGKADIMFEEPPPGQPLDVLEAGIDIQARPPGKELQRISLMSGGEKSMTAIALLLAIFRSRPSPFTILDEVDAALDEANNERFNKIIQEFLELSQFIIITHSKRTMSHADVLYGITMQEAGVSKRVSVRFDEIDRRDKVA